MSTGFSRLPVQVVVRDSLGWSGRWEGETSDVKRGGLRVECGVRRGEGPGVNMEKDRGERC